MGETKKHCKSEFLAMFRNFIINGMELEEVLAFRESESERIEKKLENESR